MMKHVLPAVAMATTLVALAAFGPLPQAAAQGSSSVSGQIVDVNHQPVGGAKVEVFADSSAPHSNAIASALSRKDGRFHVDGLKGGQYRLELTKMGYAVQILSGLLVRPDERTIIGEPVTMFGASTEYAEKMACNQLVRPDATADVYVVCGSK